MTQLPWDDAALPEGYEIDHTGVREVSDNYTFTDGPVWLARNLIDIETSQSKLEICYLVDGVVLTVEMEREKLYGQGWASILCALHRFPHPPGDESKSLRKYLYDADQCCKKTAYFSATAGWKELPSKKIEFVPFGDIVPNPTGAGAKQRFSYIKQKGSFEDWLNAVMPVLCENRRACVPFAASLAAPMLSLLQAESVVIDVFNTSSSGKTVACTLAMSIWGNGDKLKLNWDTTQVGLEQNAAAFTDLPLFFDESQLNRDPKSLGVAVYNIANGLGRVRGAAGGGTQITRTWKTCLLSTGEAALLELIPTTYAGLDARIIPVPGKTLEAMDGTEVEKLSATLRENYGWLGPLFIEHLKDFDLEDLERRWHSAIHELRLYVDTDDNIQRRKAESYAVLVVAIDLLQIFFEKEMLANEIIFDIQQFDAIHRNLILHWEEISNLHLADQIAQEALCVLMDFYATHETAFSNEKDWGKRLGKMKDGKIHFLKETWHQALTRGYAKFSPPNILREFTERGWIELDSDGKPDPRISWGGSNSKARVHILTTKAITEYNEKFKGKIFSIIDHLFELANPDEPKGGPSGVQRKLKGVK